MSIQSQVQGGDATIGTIKTATVLPTTSDTALVVISRPDDPSVTALNGINNDVMITGPSGQISTANNILNAGNTWTDIGNATSVAVSIAPSGTVSGGGVVFEASNDQSTVTLVSLLDQANPNNPPVSTITPATGTPRFLYGNVGFRYFRVRISSAITGGGSIQAIADTMRPSINPQTNFAIITDGTNKMPTMDAVARPGFQKITDGVTVAAVKAASTAAVAADPAVVVALSPNNNTAALALFAKSTDGTNTAAVKAASTVPALTDPALVTTLSPNLPAVTVYSVLSLATTNAASIKASAGKVFAGSFMNASAAVKYVRLYNLATAPTVGTSTPYAVIAIPATSSKEVEFGTLGINFGTGIAIAITNAATDLDATAVAAGDVRVLLSYI